MSSPCKHGFGHLFFRYLGCIYSIQYNFISIYTCFTLKYSHLNAIEAKIVL